MLLYGNNEKRIYKNPEVYYCQFYAHNEFQKSDSRSFDVRVRDLTNEPFVFVLFLACNLRRSRQWAFCCYTYTFRVSFDLPPSSTFRREIRKMYSDGLPATSIQ